MGGADNTSLAVAVGGGRQRLAIPRFNDALELFVQRGVDDGDCSPRQLRRIYLQLALQFHPDKRHEDDRKAATELFQAIAAAYQQLCEGSGKQHDAPRRVKSRVAAAAELGDLEELRRLLAENPDDANHVDDVGISALMFAAAGGCVAAAEILAEAGADVCYINPLNWSVLIYAALGNHAAMTRFLIERGAVVTDHELILAIFTGNPESLEVLMEHYPGSVADVITDESKKTLLHLAVEGMCFLRHSAERHADCVRLAMRWQVPVDVQEPKKGRTCLQEYIGDVRWRTRGLENSAVHMDIVDELCLYGASVTQEDRDGHSAVSIAMDMGLSKVRGTLLSYV